MSDSKQSLIFETLILNTEQQADAINASNTSATFSGDRIKRAIALVGEDFENQATLRFITELFKDNPNACLRQGVKLLNSTQVIPKNISIYLFTSCSVVECIDSDTVHSVVVKVHSSETISSETEDFLKFLLQNKHFENLHHLMLTGISIGHELASSIKTLNLTALHLNAFKKKDPCKADIFDSGFCGLNNLRKMYFTHPNQDAHFLCPHQVEEILVYCSKSDEDTVPNGSFDLEVAFRPSVKLIEVYAHQKFKHMFRLQLDFANRIEKLIWEVPYSVSNRCIVNWGVFTGFEQVYLKCSNTIVLSASEHGNIFLMSSNYHITTQIYYLDKTRVFYGLPCKCRECPVPYSS